MKNFLDFVGVVGMWTAVLFATWGTGQAFILGYQATGAWSLGLNGTLLGFLLVVVVAVARDTKRTVMRSKTRAR